jgi:triacylglycerol esterase/lipase EstA (alpha/beta hydrolase family)
MLDWYTHRGIAPNKLALEPLTNAYSNIVESLVNVGYTKGVDLFVANWDWRVPVAIADNTVNNTLTNGTLSLVTAAAITDPTYESGVDYLGYWLDKAVTAWAALKGEPLDSVDMITHSTGGLVSRSYIQSAAYNQPYASNKTLPKINNLVQSGVPNQGASTLLNLIINDFSDKSASRVMGRVGCRLRLPAGWNAHLQS